MVRSRTFFRRQAQDALPKLPDIVNRPIGANAYRMWERDLGQPEWLYAGLGCARRPLPLQMRAGDEIILVSNMLDNLGFEAMLEAVSMNPLPGASPTSVAHIFSAPNARAMLEGRCRVLTISNQFVKCDVEVTSENLGLTFTALPEIGDIGTFFEQIFVVHLIHILRFFETSLRPSETRKPMLVKTSADRAALMNVLSSVPNVEFQNCRHASKLILSREQCERLNPGHDPLVWAEKLRIIQQHEAASANSHSVLQLKQYVLQVISKERRVPRLKELAVAEGVSERTFSRRLVQIGVTYQAIVDEIRAQLGSEMLDVGDLPIGTIAEALGFSHAASFARAFHSWHGCSPSEWSMRANSL